ncbi:hypothetical protein CCY99_01025 [Helicobacter sp. 16-1353]|nr:hypothetical protein CCY99_01025 [Helicobacter sp. 16-1353]
MAKGAGMIAPEMATMLCFIATDANIPEGDMEEILRECLSETFNAISVDGDTSTNDSVFLFTTRKSRAYDKVAFKTALKMAMKKLAIDMVSDGEGATKVVAFEVKNAKNKSEAVSAAKALSNSLLVKTAIFGGDPNWGRIASTIGACGVSSDPKKLKIFIGENLLYDCEKINFEAIKSAEKTMQKDSFRVVCDLGIAESSTESGLESNAEFVAESNSTLSPTSSDFDENDAFSYTAYGCDLGYKYVEINSQYTS